MAHLFSELRLRGAVLRNRIGLAPMCQYCAQDGMADDWHLVHYGSMAVGGAGMLIVEATAVAPEGRITPYDLGLWNDEQAVALSRIAHFSSQHGCIPAIQLAHAGRKGSRSQNHGLKSQHSLLPGEGGWTVVGPSAVAHDGEHPVPAELTLHDIQQIVEDFSSAASRAIQAGFQAVEIHAGHGYLLHQFMSPLSNLRDDQYGGCFENRVRLSCQVIEGLRKRLPDHVPLLMRLSATDAVEGGWTIDESSRFAARASSLGVDLIDVSAGGMTSHGEIPISAEYIAEFSSRIRSDAAIPTSTVGLITSPEQADQLIRSGQADMVLVGREMLRNRFWPAGAARKLGERAYWPAQYVRAAPHGALIRDEDS